MTAPESTPDTRLAAHAGRWVLDAPASSATFHTKAMWLLPVRGTAAITSGDAEVTAEGAVHGRLTIDATSIATGMKKRDAHLQTADFFDTATYPTIDFQVEGARSSAEGRVALDGRLTIQATTRPVTLDASVTADGDRITLVGTIDDLDRADWGIDWAKMGAGLHNRVTVAATFARV